MMINIITPTVEFWYQDSIKGFMPKEEKEINKLWVPV